MLFDYDDRDQESIFNYAKKLEGMTFQEVLDEYNKSQQKRYVNIYDNSDNQYVSDTSLFYGTEENEKSKAKGQLGNFLETHYFGYSQNSNQEADFSKVGMELKQTCINLKKNGDYSAGERLSITNISYKEPVEDDFYNSHVWNKIKLILLVQYLRDKTKDRLQYKIMFVNRFTPPKEDLAIIIQDYTFIIEKVKNGKANEISESDTLYLGACTKGASAQKSLVPQYYGDHSLAKKRNFCFKRGYMDYVLHEYVLKNNVPFESIVDNNNLSSRIPFQEQILGLINKHIGKTDKELCNLFNREYNNNKAQWCDLAYKMLGIKGNQASEFVKANIVVKAIRIEENGKIRESMSLPTIKFKEFVKQNYEDSDFCNYFEETKFLFVIYRKENNHYVLRGAQMWNMPYIDLYGDAQIGWQKIHDKILGGITFDVKGDTVTNDLPKIKDNRIIHIRPHTQRSAYKLNNGFEKGNIAIDGDELPNGEWMTTQSLWLNNSYILSQLKLK